MKQRHAPTEELWQHVAGMNANWTQRSTMVKFHVTNKKHYVLSASFNKVE